MNTDEAGPPRVAPAIPTCPACGEMARGTLEVVHGVALVQLDAETGQITYAGETGMCWDSQTLVLRDDKPVWVCGCGHEWTRDIRPA